MTQATVQGHASLTVEDWIAVSDLIGRYCWSLDHGDGEGWAQLWTEDGCVTGFTPEPQKGRAILAQIPKIAFERSQGRMRHVFSNLNYEYGTSRDVVIARAYNHTSVWGATVANVSMAYCELTLVREGDVWLVQRSDADVVQPTG